MLAFILATIGAGAQSLDGTWVMNQKESQDFNNEENKVDGKADMDASAKYVFAGERFQAWMSVKLNMDFVAQTDDGENANANVYIKVTADNTGSLSRDGDELVLTPDAKKKPNITVDSKLDGIPGGDMLKGMMTGPIKKELSAELKKTDRYKIVSLTEDTLVLETVLSAKEVKDGKTPNRTTFTRK